jgi:raffinose/stachyose/melibiose transport system substrate-binding protein
VTDDPDDLKVRVNIDLALWIPETGTDHESARTFVEFLMRPEIMDDYNAEFLGFGTTTDAAPVTDERIVGMQEFYDESKFYQGASQGVPLTIPAANYIQAIATGGSPESTLARLDADWARLALRG